MSTPLERFGIRWAGPKEPISEPMDTGYWTPWHIARDSISDLEFGVKELAEALDWCLQQFQGDSGTGETYWEDKPEYIKATAALAKHKGEHA